MTAPVADEGWPALALQAARARAGLTQAQLAAAANLDRSVVIALEKGRRTMSSYYADLLAPPLGISPDELLPPEEADANPESPLVLLRQLGETVEKQRLAIAGLEKRVVRLERGASGRRPASGDAR